MYINGNANHQNSQKIDNRSKWVIQPSLFHDKLHVTEKNVFEYVVLYERHSRLGFLPSCALQEVCHASRR